MSRAFADAMRDGREDAKVTPLPTAILSRQDPYPGAQTFLEREYSARGERTLISQAGVFYGYAGSHWRETEEQRIRSELWTFQAGAQRYEKAGKGEKAEHVLVPFQPTSATVANALDATRALVHLDAEHQPPCWLDGGKGRPPASELVAMENGLFHLPTRSLHPHSSRFYAHNALGFRYAEDAPEPLRFLRFLKELWPDDPESIAVLQEIIGYLLTADTTQQKAFLIVGPKRSGKGTLARLLSALLGPANVCAPTLAGLAMNFGLQPLIGKQLAIISDARLSGRADQAAIAERLLSISGEDAITIDKKHLPPWTGHLPTRFLILTNELPRLADTSGALASRFVVLTLTRSFYGKEDPQLTADLLTELPGIFAWALDGWDRLIERGRFINPKSSEDAVNELEDLGSPISAFLRDRCEVAPSRCIGRKALYEAWTAWCREEGRDHAGTSATFGRDLKAALPGLRTVQHRGESRERFYEGVGLKDVFR